MKIINDAVMSLLFHCYLDLVSFFFHIKNTQLK